ncbi:MAG TPA: glycosyl hydrolase family 18 protein [Gemmatimonadaceae bacterium]|nr:glycosyl hydrolase family 18 protein [Gemmatimonadaceae bacterium]
MPKRSLAGIVAAVASISLFHPSAVLAQALERLFYYVDREDSYQSLVKNIDQITVLGPQVYTVDSLGVVFGELDSRVLALAKAHRVKVMPLVVNEAFNQPALRKLLSDTAARAGATRSLLQLCQQNGYWGIQFDIENVNIQDRDLLSSWYRETANALHRGGFTLSIAVVHRTEDNAGPTAYHRFLQDSWRAGYDLTALAKAGDFISLMTYSENTRRTPPGPVAALPWMRDNIEYFLKYVPREKLSLGIPTYGDHWYSREDRTIPERARSWAETVGWTWGSGIVERHGATMQWDSVAGVPYAYFSNGGVYEWVFLENARSFREKLNLARTYRLRGFSVWVLGPEDPAIWEILRGERKP